MLRAHLASRTFVLATLALVLLLAHTQFSLGGEGDKPTDASKQERAPADDVRQQLQDLRREVARLRNELDQKSAVLGARRQTSPVEFRAGSGTKVAILNLKYVVTHYKRFQAFQEENKAAYEVYERQLQPLASKMDALKKEKDDTAAAESERREQIDTAARLTEAKIKEITDDARDKLGKQESEQLVRIYKEVVATIRAYAEAKGIDLVVHYSDGVTDEEMQSEKNIHQKMATRALTPVYWGAKVDISLPILEMLNARYDSQLKEK